MAQAPGVNITVTSNTSNVSVQNPTGTWFALGVAAGPANIPVPIQSMNDFNSVFGQIVNGQITGRYSLPNMNSTALYDALDVYFREGGMQAFVVRVQPASTGVAATSGSAGGVWTLTAGGKGTWANSSGASAAGVILTVNFISAGNYSATIAYNGVTNASITGLSSDTDVINWVNSLPLYQGLVTASAVTPNPATVTAASATGGVVTYTAVNSFSAGQTVTIAGLSTAAFNLSNVVIATASGTQFTVTNAATGTAVTGASATATLISSLPTTTVTPLTVYMTGGTDVAVADTDVTAALASITEAYGPGQVSYPGNTNAAMYVSLANHAANNNRVALLDAPNSATAATLVSTVTTFQTNVAVVDPSYAAFFGPWLLTPGTVNTNPSTTNPYAFTRTVAPVALAAAKIAQNDAGHDANVPAAGITGGNATYVTGLTQLYGSSDRATLNAAGVNVIRNVANVGTICIYGFRSAAVNPAWIYFNNVRFRMQVVSQFDAIAEGFVFQEIDAKGQLFGKLAGALGAQCQAYWLRGSLYGATAGSAYVVNTGPTVNTPATIQAGQVNAVVSLKMSPFGEFVNISIVKYAVTATLPQ